MSRAYGTWIWLCLTCVAIGCGGGHDKCAVDQMTCGGACVDLGTDNNNCGACGSACASGQVCGNGTCAANCPTDQLECNGSCSDPTSDPANCGGCGSACPDGDVCVESQCQVPCDPTMLMSSIKDPWGETWDGLDRTAAALDAATDDCKAFGARLPTASELFRVSATQSGAVGQSFNTDYLWTEVPEDMLDQATVRLSDGATSTAVATTPTPYRCVCGEPQPRTFSDTHCNGPFGAACSAFGAYNIDAVDRPPLRTSAAQWECINDRAHLASSRQLAQAIRAGLPGSGALIQTADNFAYYAAVTMKWSGDTSAWEPSGNVSYADLRTPEPFRCIGRSDLVSPNGNAITGAFVPPTSSYTGETDDRAATTWAAAQDACTQAGGHLPYAVELGELVSQGLPNGTGNALWTADQDGYQVSNPATGAGDFLAEVVEWTALDRRFSFAYTAAADNTVTWVYKTDSHAFRCIYYPIDALVTEPTCYAGCFTVTLPGATAPTMWFDSQDRASSTLGAAYADCQASGGTLATERDLTEAVRAGLPNGTATMVSDPWIWASDFGGGAGAVDNVMIVRWSNVDTAFSDLYSTYMTWETISLSHRYRCMWTNEIR